MATKRQTEVSKLIEKAGTSAVVKGNNEELAAISALAKLQHEAALSVAACEDRLKDAKDLLRQIAEVDLPEAMLACGVKQFVTDDNLEIKLKPDVTVGISVANRDSAMEWLVEHGFGGLIKSDLSIHFDREELESAKELANTLAQQGLEPELSQSINHQSLKAFVKERMADAEAAEPFPLDLFGARPYNVAVVKPRK
jgi:hypothetical protein